MKQINTYTSGGDDEVKMQLKILIDLAPNLKPDRFAKLDQQSQRDLLWFVATTLPKLVDQEDLSNIGQETTFEVRQTEKVVKTEAKMPNPGLTD